MLISIQTILSNSAVLNATFLSINKITLILVGKNKTIFLHSSLRKNDILAVPFQYDIIAVR